MENSSRMETSEKKSSPVKSKTHRVLVIDDERDAVDLLDLILTGEGYIVDKTLTANGALKILQLNKILPDLILLDVKMPGKNGITLCAELKGNSKFKNIPIFMLSALTFPKDVAKGLAVGAEDYLFKPWCNKDLLSRINVQLS